MVKLLDVLLFPKGLYRKITEKKSTLYAGIIFIGLVDLGFILYKNFELLFINKAGGGLIRNIVLSILFVIVIGIMDVFFFSIPLFDLFKRFTKSKYKPLDKDVIGVIDNMVKNHENRDKVLFIKIMKIYIVAHFLILPAEIVIFLIYRNAINNADVIAWAIYLLLIIDLLIPIWFSGAISRGINVTYKFKPLFKSLVFIIIFVWNHILAYAFSYMIENWMFTLFK